MTTKKQSLTQADMVLIAVFRASDGTTERVAWEEIVLKAWQEFPKDFSLRNHPEFPDGEVITKRVADKLRPKGYLIALGNKFFRLTDKGKRQAQLLIEAIEGSSSIENASYRQLSREEANFIHHALGSQAYKTWASGNKNKLIDYDAKLFFRFSTGTKKEERKQKVQFAKEALQKAIDIGIAEAKQIDLLATFLSDNFEELFREE